jgi:hypothetical protein
MAQKLRKVGYAMRSMACVNPRRLLPRLAACLVAGVAASLVPASTAWGAPTITPGTGAYWNAENPTPAYRITSVDGEAVAWTATGPGYTLAGTGGTATLTAFPEGAGTLTATDSTGPAEVTFTKDTVAPTLGATLVGTPNAAGWYRQLAIGRSPCSDADPSSGLPAGACGNRAWTTDGAALSATVSVSDNAGNGTTVTSPAFNFDGTPPTTAGGRPSAPTSGAQVSAEPEFRWTRGVDATSGPARYELDWRHADGTDWQTIARVEDTGVGDYTARRDPALRPEPLPQNEPLQWRVRTFDAAGNVRVSTSYLLTIDATVLPPPVITGGPNTPTRITSPTFTWTGTQETYLWRLTVPGQQNPVRSGGGLATEATLQSLGDGDYTFSVTQVSASGRESEAATRSFKVDTTPPAAPTITLRPQFPAAGTVTFGWTAEPGAYSRWQVVGAGGAVVLGPADTPLTSVSIANLADGAYSFQVLQIDSAGNASATTSEPFTVATPVAPGARPAPRIAPEFLLPTQNAFRLRPKAGRTLPTRSPVLAWRRGPRGTRLYNVQIFKVLKKRAGAAPTVKKVYSGFPKKRQLRAPRKVMQAGTCYVWRVWPYTGTRFTPKPLGISNFCVAKASVLKKHAAKAAARRRARAANLR